MSITADQARDWIVKLRSGEYRQIQNRFSDESNGRCAVGVFICSHGYNINTGVAGKVSIMNDHELKSFAEIADWLEQHYFGGSYEFA